MCWQQLYTEITAQMLPTQTAQTLGKIVLETVTPVSGTYKYVYIKINKIFLQFMRCLYIPFTSPVSLN